ncbi:DNA adenine methylase [Candidimonas nitroreducens]|uniref:site-specific DNA-methyltransferase (adenine-specific) n=1 Tax=Candidimonas nitroreducens TaxID=683354 RepID=A0A225MAQ8_9BURK|nr:DNA adenine methylase [Candidimonas nitroreducens]OWT58384.1 adenine methyltransferase [Candidimonas nitroreducens]
MRTSSPLRYPGGKSAMADLLRRIRNLNQLGEFDLAEPFAGGAGASLSLLFQEEVPCIHLNDADPAIFDFWWTLKNRPAPFLSMIDTINVDMQEWVRQRSIYKKKSPPSRLQRGFSAFYLNRCNRSGIIMNGGPIGGINQTGKWKIDARFNRNDLRRRCERISEYKDRILITGDDGLNFIKSVNRKKTLLFIDPPYFVKGSLLYLNLLNPEYHEELAEELKASSDLKWVVTYDDCPEIRRLYEGWANVREFSLRYAAAERRRGKEILITPKGMILPDSQESLAIQW